MPNVVFKKPRKRPLLKQHHKEARLEFAREHMQWVEEWGRVFFRMRKNLILMVLTVSVTTGMTSREITLPELAGTLKVEVLWYGELSRLMENSHYATSLPE